MKNEPKTINKYEQAKLVSREDIERFECSEDDNSGCPYYSDGSDESIKAQSKTKSKKRNFVCDCKE